MRRVILHIDRVVLRGFGAEERDDIVAGLRSELERHFADAASGARLASIPHVPKLDGGSVNLPRDGEATHTGIAIGGAVARGLKQ